MKGNVKVIDMLTKKEINKIRTMYYEQNYNVTEIKRIMIVWFSYKEDCGPVFLP